jgi:ATP-GRASP peptide maturase of grasp-with-spasm system
MILILSRSVSETSTNKVIDYLINKNAPFFRFNGDDFINEKLKINFYFDKISSRWKFDIATDEIQINSDSISVVWFRRDFFDELEKLSDESVINTFLKNEIKQAYNLISLSLDNVLWINRPNEIKNKLHVLQLANKAELNVPYSFVTNNLSYLEKIIEDKYSLITKPLNEGIGIVKDNKKLTTFTSIVDIEKIREEIDEYIIPTFFQSLIDKEYEIRTFFFFGKCYSIAIFSQNDCKTKIDFRDYNIDKPNKMSRYKLPESIERKVNKLMNQLEINSGSIDFIRNKQGLYIFLEINPVGQFDFLEIQGNYSISEIIAKKLMKINEKN